MTFFKSRCYNGGNKHKFLARYDEIPHPRSIKTSGHISSEKMRNLLYYQKYLFDICEWCGKKIINHDR